MGARAQCAGLAMVAVKIAFTLLLAVVAVAFGSACGLAVAYADETPSAETDAVESKSAESSSQGASEAEPGSASSAKSEDAQAAESKSGKVAEGDDEDDPSEENLVDPTQRADNSFIYDTTIDSLFEQAPIYEGDTVQVVGEVIGDLIKADEGGREMYWIMLTSTETENKSSISVLLTAEQARQIDHFGRYGVTGTTLQVRGTFHQACEEHEGLPDLHATTVSALARGVEHPDSFRLREFLPGGVAVLIGVILLGVYYFVRERSR